MECQYCLDCKKKSNKSAYLCKCSNIYLCEEHLGKHKKLRGSHKIVNLLCELSEGEKLKLDKLIDTIVENLKKFTEEIHSQTKNLITNIRAIETSLKMKISKLLERFREIKNTGEFSNDEIEKIDFIMNSDTSVKHFDLIMLTKKITSWFEIEKYLNFATYLINENENHLILVQSSSDPNLNSPKPCPGFFSPQIFVKTRRINQKRFLNIDEVNNDRRELENRGEFLKSNTSGFRCLAISNDGNIMITGSDDNSIRFWNLTKYTQEACSLKHKSTIWSVDISPCGLLAASGSSDRSVIIWDALESKFKSSCYGHTGAVLTVKFSKNSKFLFSGSYTCEIIHWSLDSLKCIRKIVVSQKISTSIVVDDKYFAGVGNNLEVWNLVSHQIINSISQSTEVNLMALSSNELLLAICGYYEKQIKIICTRAIYTLKTINIEKLQSRSICFALKDSIIIIGTYVVGIYFWNIEGKTIVFKKQYDQDTILGLVPFKDTVYSAYKNSSIGIWNVPDRTVTFPFPTTNFQLGTEYIDELITLYASHNCVIVNKTGASNQDFNFVFNVSKEKILKIYISPSKKTFISVSAGNKNNTVVWDLKNKIRLSVLSGIFDQLTCADFSSDEKYLALGTTKGSVLLYNYLNYTLDFELKLNDSKTLNNNTQKNLEKSQNNRLILLSTSQIRNSMSIVYENNFSIPEIIDLKFSKNGKFIVFGSNKSYIFIWDLMNKSICKKIDFIFECLEKLFITKDDKYIVCASQFKGIDIMDVNDGELKQRFDRLEEANQWLKSNNNLATELLKFLF